MSFLMNGPTPAGEFQSHFGGTPGASDPASECKKWETLCGTLLAERESLRAELAKSQADCLQFRNALLQRFRAEFKPDDFDEAVGFAHLKDKPTLRELIAELECNPGS
jgi:hypothetical protein